MGVGLGALLVTLLLVSPNICPVEIVERGQVGFLYWQLVISALFIDSDGTHALISAEWNWRVQLLIPAILSLSLRRWPGATFLNPRAGWNRGTVSGSRESHAEYRRRRHTPTGKPLPPVVIADDGKAPQAVHIQPY